MITEGDNMVDISIGVVLDVPDARGLLEHVQVNLGPEYYPIQRNFLKDKQKFEETLYLLVLCALRGPPSQHPALIFPIYFHG